MWTQRDQLQAYQFLRRRLVSALVAGDANHPVSPSRRLVIGIAVGVGLALLVTAAFGIYGLLRPDSGASWRTAGQVVVDKDSGANYVLGKDGRLHPMLNYASARLLAGGDGRATDSVSAKSLRQAPRGAPLGIDGAPDSLPAADELLTGHWTVCSQQPVGRPAGAQPVATVSIGAKPAGTAIGPANGILLADPSGHQYLLADGHRFRVTDQSALVSIGFDRTRPVPVTWSFVDAVPAGTDLAPMKVADVGDTGPLLGGHSTLVGQVLRSRPVGDSAYRYYLVRADGVAPLTETAASLLLNSAELRDAYPGGTPHPLDVSGADLVRAVLPAGDSEDGYPQQLPRPVTVPLAEGIAVCVTGQHGALTDVMLATSPAATSARPVRVSGGDDRTADQVWVPPGRGALVRSGTTYLITDQGQRFPVADAEARKALGYGNVAPVRVPATVLALFPTGPVLSGAAAARVH